MASKASNTVDTLQSLIMWARAQKIVLSTITIGDVTVEIERDHGLIPPTGPAAPAERKANIFEQHAGPLAAFLNGEAMPVEQQNETTVEDEEP